MYLHIGSEQLVKTSDIVAIINLRTCLPSSITQEFLNKNKNSIVEICEEPKKSIVISNKNHKNVLYSSNISSVTLKERANFYKEITK